MTKPEKLQVSAAEWQIIAAILSLVEECEVWAFGSRTKGEARQYSDLDLGLIGQGPISHQQLAQLREAFTESDLCWTVDLVDYQLAGPTIQQAIKQGIRLR